VLIDRSLLTRLAARTQARFTALGQKVGEITDVYPELDLALVKLDPTVKFSNSLYFTCAQPKKLLECDEIL
jgi:hypothetical protein